MLGTVDRASLHDLVLDFAVGLHDKIGLESAHHRVVEAFRRRRPVNPAGLQLWDLANRDDAMTVYVLDEVVHHVQNSRDSSSQTIAGDETILAWLEDQPQDALVFQVGSVLGEETLCKGAEVAESAGDLWAAACRWAAAANVAEKTRGLAACVPLLGKAVEAIARVQLHTGASMTGQLQLDQLELACIRSLVLYDLANAGSHRARVNRLLASDAAKACPDSCFTMSLVGYVIPAWANGQNRAMATEWLRIFQMLVKNGCEGSPDPNMRDSCAILVGGISAMYLETMLCCPQFDWAVFGEDGRHLRRSIACYDYAKHHLRWLEMVNADHTLMSISGALGLALHFGDLEAVDTAIATQLDGVSRMMVEPNQALEQLVKGVIGGVFWHSLLGKAKEKALIASQLGLTWETADATLDAITDDDDSNAYFAPRGQVEGSTRFLNMDTFCWSAKFVHALCAPQGAVHKDEMAGSMPDAENLSKMGFKSRSKDSPGGDVQSAPGHILMSPHLVAALACERKGLHEDALSFATVIHDVDPNLGGDVKPTSHILAFCLKGRIFQQRGQLKAAAAAFEAAVTEAEKHGLWLLVAFALRDLKLYMLDNLGHADHGARRLAEVVRRLKGPSSSLTALLGGLDVLALVNLPEPEAAYEVKYGEAQQDSVEHKLREELTPLKVSALKRQAVAEGIDQETVELVDDSHDPKAALISLLVEAHTLAQAKSVV